MFCLDLRDAHRFKINEKCDESAIGVEVFKRDGVRSGVGVNTFHDHLLSLVLHVHHKLTQRYGATE